jgi:hypothetical protein
MTNDVVLIDARSGDWLNNYLNPGAARLAWYGIPGRMQDHLALVIVGGGGHIISVLEGVPTGGVQRAGSQRAQRGEGSAPPPVAPQMVLTTY